MIIIINVCNGILEHSRSGYLINVKVKEVNPNLRENNWFLKWIWIYCYHD